MPAMKDELSPNVVSVAARAKGSLWGEVGKADNLEGPGKKWMLPHRPECLILPLQGVNGTYNDIH